MQMEGISSNLLRCNAIPTMKVDQILHMEGGLGEVSYANNSIVQRRIITKTQPILEETVKELCYKMSPQCLTIADLGCSSGPNALLIASEIINVIYETCRSLNRQPPKFGLFLNDLPGNDFNTIFNLLPSFYKRLEEEKGSDFGPCFVSGTPRSFYGSVFPDQFLHFVHSSYSVHWLSQIPEGLMDEKGVALNERNIYIAKTSSPEVQKAYYVQFQRDFTLFLRLCAREMINGGRMVLTVQGSFNNNINSNDPDTTFELLGSTLHDMVLEGVVEQEKLESFNLPFYAPTAEEVRQLVEAEGSFALNRLETFTVDWSVNKTVDLENRAKFVAKCIRVVTEPMLASLFGEAIMDDLFLRYKSRVKERMARETSDYLNILVSFTRKG